MNMTQTINRNVLIQAHWPGNRRRTHEVLALVTYPANEEQKANDIVECAWILYEGQLIEAFYFEGYGWTLDDIGINNITVNHTPDGYPGAEYLRGTGWKLEPKPGIKADDYFWIPSKNIQP